MATIKRTWVYALTVSIFLIFTSACDSLSYSEAVTELGPISGIDDPIVSTFPDPYEKIYLNEADEQVLADATFRCPENNKGLNDCFIVCHVPPGNPSNSKTLMLPYPAIAAHLNHGSGQGHGKGKGKGKAKGHEKKKDRGHGDYLGYCDDSNPPAQDPPEEDPNEEDPNEEDPNEEDPPFCDASFEDDLDCDGFHDVTGEPIIDVFKPTE